MSDEMFLFLPPLTLRRCFVIAVMFFVRLIYNEQQKFRMLCGALCHQKTKDFNKRETFFYAPNYIFFIIENIIEI